MAQHKVETTGRLPVKGSRKANDRDVHSRGVHADETDENGVAGAEHKVPLSEAVLMAVGLHGGTDTSKKGKGAVIDKRDAEGAVFTAAPKSADDCHNMVDVVKYLEAKNKGYFETTKVRSSEGGMIRTARLTYGDAADVATGSGKTMKDAVKALAEKLGESFKCLEPDYEEGASDE